MSIIVILVVGFVVLGGLYFWSLARAAAKGDSWRDR